MALEASTFRKAVTENTLRSCELFMGLPAADIAAIGSFVIPKHLDKSDYFFRDGDRSESVYRAERRDQRTPQDMERVRRTGY